MTPRVHEYYEAHTLTKEDTATLRYLRCAQVDKPIVSGDPSTLVFRADKVFASKARRQEWTQQHSGIVEAFIRTREIDTGVVDAKLAAALRGAIQPQPHPSWFTGRVVYSLYRALLFASCQV